jgi:signal transduction histidine kinase
VGDDFFVITNLADIKGEQEKRKQLLERTIANSNSPGDLSGLTEMIGKADERGQLDTLTETLEQIGTQINDEIVDFQRLKSAENDELKVYITPTTAYTVLDNVVRTARSYKAALGKEILLAPPFPQIALNTDIALLQQVLQNMLKNALEAIPQGGNVYIGYEKIEYAITFYVFNEGAIPMDIKSRIFKREFSTKEKGRGFGTYSMKLFGERYLKGYVNFESSEETGTRFYITLPMLES